MRPAVAILTAWIALLFGCGGRTLSTPDVDAGSATSLPPYQGNGSGSPQAACPLYPPPTGSSCSNEGAACGYLTSAVACDGSVDCSCQNGEWSCAPTCVAPEDASSGDPMSGPDGSSTIWVDAAAVMYSGPCMISAASYDQSCAVDTDCTEVTSADYCIENCLCGGSAINTAALAQFNDDVANTPLGSGAFGPGAGVCPCASQVGPCCRNGLCTLTCSSPADTLPACADAGGGCFWQADTTCANAGPSTSCVYSDEVCCL
jgi:hypothetical protein